MQSDRHDEANIGFRNMREQTQKGLDGPPDNFREKFELLVKNSRNTEGYCHD